MTFVRQTSVGWANSSTARRRKFLEDEGFAIDALGGLDPSEMRLARTSSRRLLGIMKEDAHMAEHMIARAGGLEHINARDLNRRLRRNLHSSPSGYITSLDNVQGWRQPD